MRHFPINGDKNLKAVCGTMGLVRKTTDPTKVTCRICAGLIAAHILRSPTAAVNWKEIK